MNIFLRRIFFTLTCCIGFLSAVAHSADFVFQDPIADIEYPPSLVELEIPSNGSIMNGHMYIASGEGPHPTVIFTHGFPGNERNLDLAQALRRGGFNALFFHYRGAWGSEGEYNVKNAVIDTKAVFDYLQSEVNNADLHIDSNKISIIGHSVGGFIALKAGQLNKELKCTVALAPGNLYETTKRFHDRDDDGSPISLPDALGTPQVSLNGYSIADVFRSVIETPAYFDLASSMDLFEDRPLMIVAGEYDQTTTIETIEPFVEAAKNHTDIYYQVFKADHSFSQKRITLARSVSNWMINNCTN